MSKLCLNCHDPISEKRLAALPNAALCLGCQSSADAQVEVPKCRNMERLGNVVTRSDDDYKTQRPLKLHLVTHGLACAI